MFGVLSVQAGYGGTLCDSHFLSSLSVSPAPSSLNLFHFIYYMYCVNMCNSSAHQYRETHIE